jgi:hypothetical protein
MGQKLSFDGMVIAPTKIGKALQTRFDKLFLNITNLNLAKILF